MRRTVADEVLQHKQDNHVMIMINWRCLGGAVVSCAALGFSAAFFVFCGVFTQYDVCGSQLCLVDTYSSP
jgi:hypothetical protein